MGGPAVAEGHEEGGTPTGDGSAGEGDGASQQSDQSGAGSGGSGTPAGSDGLAEYKKGLHPQLQDLSPEQITELFTTMSSNMRTEALAGKEVPPVVEAEPKPKPVTTDQMKEWMDPNSEGYDPEKAITATFEKNYRPLVEDIQNNALQGVFGNLRSRVRDFDKYEDRIKQELAKSKTPATAPQIMSTYLALKGLETYNKEQADLAKAASVRTERPSPPVPPTKEIELSEIEKAAAPKMFPRAETQADAEEQYKKFATADIMEHGIEVKVPVGGGETR